MPTCMIQVTISCSLSPLNLDEVKMDSAEIKEWQSDKKKWQSISTRSLTEGQEIGMGYGW